jgi:hypothetical protein
MPDIPAADRPDDLPGTRRASLPPETRPTGELDRLQTLCHHYEGSIRVLQMIGSSLDLEEVLVHFDREARRLAAFDRVTLLLHLDGEPDHVRLLSVSDTGGLLAERISRDAARGMQVLGEWRPLRRQLWPGDFNAPDDARHFAAGIRTVFEVPLSLPDAPLGVVTYGSFDEDALRSPQTIVLGALAASLGQAVANCRRVERLEEELDAQRARQGQPGATDGIAPDAIRAVLADHLGQTPEWFNGLAQGLLLAGAMDTYQVERLEAWWTEASGVSSE